VVVDEHHPALLWHFASLAVLYKTVDLLTYLLRDNVFTWSIPVLCRYVTVSLHVVCLWKNTIKMCNKKHNYGSLMIVWRE